MTLREAAGRTARSVTTLRRYIRSGRLVAEKRRGRFGPEYFVSEEALTEAGLEPDAPPEATGIMRRPGTALRSESDVPAHTSVPVTLFQELQMKHEQLLVQYGMVRVGGMRVLELRSELEARQRELEASEERISRLRDKFREETGRLKQLLRRVEFEQAGRGLEISALREKVRGLEMLTRSTTSDATIEKQFSEVMEQMRRIDHLSGQPRPATPHDEPDH